MKNTGGGTEGSSANLEAPVQPPAADYRKKAGKAAEEFEALFIREMLGQMRKTTREMAGADSIFSQSINSDMMDFADMAVADQLARQRVFGIANTILAQLLPSDGKVNGNNAIKENTGRVASVSQNEPETGAGLAAFATPLYPLTHR
ncbi:MAG TPA: flagellar biosynthesis protein FlgJ [Pseudogulbenkiania sp.]|nr:flagellar biosynthesis protein FlgJ [Pseudogulbenkiania sp.]